MLSEKEKFRYSRHFVLNEVGEKGQEKLKQAKVLVIGAGGLGCPALQYLSAAGVGTIGIVDFDKVDISNLQRQILFTTEDIGKNKAAAAAHKLSLLNPYLVYNAFNTKFTSENAEVIVSQYDIIIDGTDNFNAKYLINDVCISAKKPFVYASVLKFEGQLSVFNYENGPSYRDIFPEAPDNMPSCEEAGVLGVLSGIIGTMQANEVLKIILGIGEVLSGRLLIFDALTLQATILKIKKSGSVNVYYSDTLNSNKMENKIKEITVEEYKEMKEAGKPHQLIDVREEWEYEERNMGGELIPMADLMSNTDKIARDKPVIIHCKGGGRSARAVQMLQDELGIDNLYNLKGGITAWK